MSRLKKEKINKRKKEKKIKGEKKKKEKKVDIYVSQVTKKKFPS